jgi:CopG family nickel-responsive transcriptional regulator
VGELARFGVSLEKDLLAAFDGLCRKRGYANRSEALRHCIRRELAEENAADPSLPAAGVLTVVYDHHGSDLSRRLTAMQHEAHESVTATLHVHLDPHHCLEVIALRGKGGVVRDLADRLRSARGILQSSLSLSPVLPDGSAASAGTRA